MDLAGLIVLSFLPKKQIAPASHCFDGDHGNPEQVPNASDSLLGCRNPTQLPSTPGVVGLQIMHFTTIHIPGDVSSFVIVALYHRAPFSFQLDDDAPENHRLP
jgi:hypothetical protein